jgi:hypothetical protein
MTQKLVLDRKIGLLVQDIKNRDRIPTMNSVVLSSIEDLTKVGIEAWVKKLDTPKNQQQVTPS